MSVQVEMANDISQEKTHIQLSGQKRTLIAGWSRMAHKVCDQLLDDLREGYDVLGFFNVFPMNGDFGSNHRNIPLLGDFGGLRELVINYKCNHIVIAIDAHEYREIHTIIEFCSYNNLTYELINDNYDIIYGHSLRYIAVDSLANLDFSFHRILEFFAAVIMMIIFAPVFLMVALMVKLDSPGSVLYSQERVGKKGRIFRIFKFRTMVQDAEKVSGPQLATKKDPRITRSGRFMRKTRLDEIPQLINIITGDMSFIGPRPERPFFVDKYSRQIPFYKNRLKVKPGVTGLAQIKVGYDETIADVMEKVKWDLRYIENKSLFLDIKILFMTLRVVLTAQGQ